MKRLICLLSMLGLLVVGSVQAQVQPISLEVALGLDGILKPGTWGGATITLANNGNDVVGKVDWRWQGGGPIFEQTIDLPRGANKRFVLPIYNFNFARGVTVRFLVNNRVVAQKETVVDLADQTQMVVGIVSEDGLAFPELDRTLEFFSNHRLLQLQPADLPERAELLESINTLLITTDTAVLKPAQRAALAGWVTNGGQLILNGGQNAIANGLPDLAPASLTAAAPTETLLTTLGPEFQGFADDLKVAVQPVTPKPDTIVRRTNDQPIWAVQRNYGNGTVTQATFDLAPISAGTELLQSQQLWSLVIPIRQNVLQQNVGNNQWLLQSALGLPSLRLPSLWSILLFSLGYLVLVGPINYLILRRLDRREWAYVTIPITVLIFTVGAYVWGTAGRGRNVILNELTIVQVPSGSATGQATSYIGLFSPTRSTYNLTFPPETLLAESDPFQRTVDNFRVLRTETGVELPEVLVDVGALESFSARHTVTVPPVSAVITTNFDNTITVRNQSDQPLRDVVLAYQRRGLNIGDLAPGQERTSPLPTENDFIEQLDLPTEGIINHQQVLINLVTNGNFFMENVTAPVAIDEFGNPTTDPTAIINAGANRQNDLLASNNLVTVLAWLDQTLLPIQIDGSAARSQGETLLVVGGTYVNDR